MNAIEKQENTEATRLERDREYATPVVNILEAPEAYMLEADMPGVNKEGLEITVDGTTLTLVGHRVTQPEAAEQMLYGETLAADYRRVFELDPSLDPAKISARIDQGLLVVTLPKAEKAKPRKIEVSVS